MTQKQLQYLLKKLLPQVGKILGKTSAQLQIAWCEFMGEDSLTEFNEEQTEIIINRCRSVISANKLKNYILHD
jgi:hypothetical protein